MAKKKTTAKRKTTSKKRKKSLLSKKDQKSMIQLVAIVVGVLILIALLFNYHFVITKKGMRVVEKESWGAKDTFANTKNWGPLDWVEHEELLKALGKKEAKDFIDRF
jgi:hypothetical protein